MKSNWVFLCKVSFGFDLNYGMETNLHKLGAWLQEIVVGKIFLLEDINFINNQKKNR